MVGVRVRFRGYFVINHGNDLMGLVNLRMFSCPFLSAFDT